MKATCPFAGRDESCPRSSGRAAGANLELVAIAKTAQTTEVVVASEWRSFNKALPECEKSNKAGRAAVAEWLRLSAAAPIGQASRRRLWSFATGRVETDATQALLLSPQARLPPSLSVSSTTRTMARATRSAGQPDKDKGQDTAPAPRKGGSKKRKRISNPDTGEQPATKQQRTSESQEPPEIPSEQPDTDTPTDALGSGDVPVDSADAEKILLVLESCAPHTFDPIQTTEFRRFHRIDTQGLLDRVFPLPTESAEPSSGESTSTSTPSTSTQTFSFRTLLKDSPQYPLRVLRVRVSTYITVFGDTAC